MPTYNDRSAVPSPQPAPLGPVTERSPKEVHLQSPAIRCVSASARQDCSATACCNAAATTDGEALRTSRYISAPQLAKVPRPWTSLGVSLPANSTAALATGCWRLSPMARPSLSACTAWSRDRGEEGPRAGSRSAGRYVADDPRLPKPGIVRSINGVRTRLCLAVGPWRTQQAVPHKRQGGIRGARPLLPWTRGAC